MSEFELVYLFDESAALLGAQMDTFLTILFAVVAAAYLVADKLTKTMVYVAIGLFTEATALVGFAMYRTSHDLVNLAGEIRSLGQTNDSALAFHTLANEPALIMASVPWLFMGLLAVSYGAVLLLFFHVRARGKLVST